MKAYALTGLEILLNPKHRALPCAIACRPFRARKCANIKLNYYNIAFQRLQVPQTLELLFSLLPHLRVEEAGEGLGGLVAFNHFRDGVFVAAEGPGVDGVVGRHVVHGCDDFGVEAGGVVECDDALFAWECPDLPPHGERAVKGVAADAP